MRNSLRILGIGFAALFAAPTLAQTSLFDASQGTSQLLGTPSGSTSGTSSVTGSGSGASVDAPLVPSLSDIHSPLTTITNRPSAGAAGAKPTEQQKPEQFDARAERNEFQAFVMQSTGRDLPLFGSNLFRGVPSSFAPVDDIPVTPDYVVGPGDEIQIRAWGQIDVDYSAMVDRNGTISVPKIGVVNVAGIKASDLPNYLKTVFSRSFRNFQLTATLGKLRSIRIYVVGQAKRPGSYTVSSLSTLVTALFAAGGPSSKGSMRSIQLKRDNHIVTDLDLYDLLVSGDKSRDAQLLPGDVIYIQPIGPLVAVTGSVNVPAVYELKQNTPLFDLIRWSGGLATTAAGQKATVERIDEHKTRKVEEFPLDVTGLSRPVKDGDLVTVYALTPRFDNAVTLRGNVAQPGRFPWRVGLRVRDLIPDKEALLSPDYWTKRNQVVGLDKDVANILNQQAATGTNLSIEDLNERRKPDSELDRTIGDTIRRTQTEAEAAKFLNPQQTSGAARSSSQLNAGQNQDIARLDAAKLEAAKADSLRLVNQIKPSTLEVNWDYAVVERMNHNDLTTSLIPFNLEKAIAGDAQQNVLLAPGDVVTVFSKEDVRVPVSRQTKYIRLEGEFKSSGVYQALPGETLRQLIARVGGFTPGAYVFGARFTRESTRVEQTRILEEAINRLERDMQRFNVIRQSNLTQPVDAAALAAQSASQQALLSRLRQLRPAGRIVLGLAEDAKLKDLPDLALEDGDRLFVPAAPSMVTVYGSVYNETSFLYNDDKRVVDYIAQAGGPTKDADKSSIYLLRADGSVISKQQTGFLLGSLDGFRPAPGDSIVVPEEFDRVTWMRSLQDWTQILYQFGLGAAAVSVLKNN